LIFMMFQHDPQTTLPKTARSADQAEGSAFIHFGRSSLSRRAEVASWLSGQPWAGRIISGEDLAELGQIPGDDLLAVDMAKSSGSNRNGVPGLTAMAVRFSEQEDAIRRDCGMHGGLDFGWQWPWSTA
jgi:hypothetical protein